MSEYHGYSSVESVPVTRASESTVVPISSRIRAELPSSSRVPVSSALPSPTRPLVIQPVARLFPDFQHVRSTLNAGLPIEAIKSNTLLALAEGPFMVLPAGNAVSALREFQSAASIPQAVTLRDRLLFAVRQEHQQCFVTSLAAACSRAGDRIGFPASETVLNSSEGARLVLQNPGGAALVVQISCGVDGDPRLEVETAGVFDGSCHAMLEDFERALAEEGVRATHPIRRDTGGVPQLDAVRQFLARTSIWAPASRTARSTAPACRQAPAVIKTRSGG